MHFKPQPADRGIIHIGRPSEINYKSAGPPVTHRQVGGFVFQQTRLITVLGVINYVDHTGPEVLFEGVGGTIPAHCTSKFAKAIGKQIYIYI